MKTYLITSKEVEKTRFFNSLNPWNQNHVLNKFTMEKIQNGVNISLNRGYEYYVQIASPRHFIAEIVRELHQAISNEQ